MGLSMATTAMVASRMGEKDPDAAPGLVDRLTMDFGRQVSDSGKDTIEYNARAFKTQPNAAVEDLLKKLPGVGPWVERLMTTHAWRSYERLERVKWIEPSS